MNCSCRRSLESHTLPVWDVWNVSFSISKSKKYGLIRIDNWRSQSHICRSPKHSWHAPLYCSAALQCSDRRALRWASIQSLCCSLTPLRSHLKETNKKSLYLCFSLSVCPAMASEKSKGNERMQTPPSSWADTRSPSSHCHQLHTPIIYLDSWKLTKQTAAPPRRFESASWPVGGGDRFFITKHHRWLAIQ